MLTEPQKPRQRSKRARPQAKRRRAGLSAPNMRRALTAAAGALCVAALGGIAFNALSLQKTRHPAPLFAHAPAPPALKEPAAQVLVAPPAAPLPKPQLAAPSRVEDVPVPEAAPARPAPANAADAPPRDGITDLLLGKAPDAKGPETQQAPATAQRTVLAAQKALVKLGFVLKPDGVMGATTRQAIERYERDHHRVSNGELTPAVMRRLSAASGEPIN